MPTGAESSSGRGLAIPFRADPCTALWGAVDPGGRSAFGTPPCRTRPPGARRSGCYAETR
jgi:hypothetical protein